MDIIEEMPARPRLSLTLVRLSEDRIRVDADSPHPGCPPFRGVCLVIDASTENPLLEFPKPLGMNAVEAIVKALREGRGQ